MSARMRVDFIACDGRGLCAEALPELITLDDWGYPIVSDQPVPPRLLPDARETARACPLLALRLDRFPAPMVIESGLSAHAGGRLASWQASAQDRTVWVQRFARGADGGDGE